MRALLGGLAGLLASVLGFFDYRGVVLALVLYVASYYLARYVFEVNTPAKEGRKLITSGLGSFIMLFLFVWILYYTYLCSALPACAPLLQPPT